MKIKKLLLSISSAILLIGIIVVLYLFLPRPIVTDISTSRVVRIQYNPYFNQEMDARIEIINYDEDRILDCLNRYTEYRIINNAGGYWIGDVELEVIIDTGDGFKNILLGNDNYSYESYGKPQYSIQKANNLKSELFDMMTIPQ